MNRRSLLGLLPLALSSEVLRGEDLDFGKPTLPSSCFFLHGAKILGSADDHYIPVVDGSIHTGFNIKLHQTELAPHATADPPHHHRGEELFMVREGRLQVEIDGKLFDLGPGEVAYVASNVPHGTSNRSGEWVRYFALLLGSPNA